MLWVSSTLMYIWCWFVGTKCPYKPCHKKIYGWKKHNCAGSPEQFKRATIKQLRELLERKAAGKNVYDTEKLVDKLEDED